MRKTTDKADENSLKKNMLASCRSEKEVLTMNNNNTQKIRVLIDTGATSSIALGRLFIPEKLQNNLSPVKWIQQSASFATNKFAMLKLMLQ